MALDILYFAWVREAVGVASESVDLPEGANTIADLIAWLAARSAGHAEGLNDISRLRAALDQKFVPLDTAIEGARELAIFPPVTGG